MIDSPAVTERRNVICSFGVRWRCKCGTDNDIPPGEIQEIVHVELPTFSWSYIEAQCSECSQRVRVRIKVKPWGDGEKTK